MIQVLTTGCQRREVLQRTLRSFSDHLWGAWSPDMILNIDPAGPDGGAIPALKAAYFYCAPSLVRTPATAHFGVAFAWVWSKATAEYCLWLEDDWELLRPVDLAAMVAIMRAEPDLAVLRLPWKAAGQDGMKAWRHVFPWNGRYFECPAEHRREVGFCGHPSLVRGEFVRRCAGHLHPGRNPEKQFHRGNPGLSAEVDRWRFGVWGRPGDGPAVRDIGREWMGRVGLAKAGNKAFFTNWTRVEEEGPCRS